MVLVGVDLGTSSVKMLLMEENGDIKKIVTREYPLSIPRPGWSEQNPEDWWNAFKDGLAELLSEADHSQVAGISFSGQMHGLVILDGEDNVIRPAILWNDGRTQKECDYLNKTIGREKISSYTGNMALTGFTAPKILWVKENEPENFAKINKIMLPKDYIAYRLSGVHCTDVSDASGMLLLDVKNKKWSKEMLELCSINESQLAKLHESYEAVGTLTAAIAAELDLPQTVKVVAGGGDQAVGAVGTGTVGHGMCSVSLGTSGTVFIVSKEFAVDDANALHSFAHADGQFHFMGCTLAAAASNKWWMDEIIRTTAYGDEQKGITNDKLGKNGVYYLPYLMGERTPINNPNARGTFTGLMMNTSREDMTQAVLEGVAFSLRDALEIARSFGVTIDRIRINGGGSKSPLWCKIMANVMNVKVDKINSAEGPAFGAAILAAVGCGFYPSVKDATSKLISVVETTEQDADLVALYDKRYQVWKQLYPAMKDVFDVMAEAEV
ncbi:MAG: xylulokinase [Lachnospiraceae bacterium]|nr:xylulokinase [Lachnospiraceae bacterium]